MHIPKLELDKVKGVLFDLDGTLYDLDKMQKIMRRKILFHLITKPWKYQEILLVYYFRKDRKNSAGAYVPDLNMAQYSWLQKRFDLPLKKLIVSIEKWMFELPLEHLEALAFPSIYPFLALLKAKKIPFGVHSDLPLGKKLAVLKVQPNFQSDATDQDINSLKPHPGAIKVFAKKLKIQPEEVLVLGDKKELDGKMAKEAHAQFFHIQTRIANQQYEMLAGLIQGSSVFREIIISAYPSFHLNRISVNSMP